MASKVVTMPILIHRKAATLKRKQDACILYSLKSCNLAQYFFDLVYLFSFIFCPFRLNYQINLITESEVSEMNTDSYLASITCKSDESDSLKLLPSIPSLQLMSTDSVSEYDSSFDEENLEPTDETCSGFSYLTFFYYCFKVIFNLVKNLLRRMHSLCTHN
ncbi:hypothetical protein T11_13620 [Trichinella zimbabwensis]|uniref:Uncharacterized protein n=1 Tax=Trichinella zimbabwensis TaxID=268475 RepID=A0A0V1GZH5_9BILA|nr:hypothetical protein T11_13620 [Trichinella zimbabwensis]